VTPADAVKSRGHKALLLAPPEGRCAVVGTPRPGLSATAGPGWPRLSGLPGALELLDLRCLGACGLPESRSPNLLEDDLTQDVYNLAIERASSAATKLLDRLGEGGGGNVGTL
jgi:hypothetical protein